MSQHSRAERRRHDRGGSNPPPKRRDPMNAIYIGFVVLIAVIAAAFFGMRLFQDHQLAQARATPTPGPNATGHVVQLIDGQKLGKVAFKAGDTSAGGQGSPVDGIACEASEGVELHVHAHVAVFANGTQIEIPKAIGFAPEPPTGCLYWLHTHDESGIIHVESPQLNAPSGGPFTLGMLFDIWGEPLSANQVATYKGKVTAYVNGAQYNGDFRAIMLVAHQQIVLEVGSPVVKPVNYAFPPND